MGDIGMILKYAHIFLKWLKVEGVIIDCDVELKKILD